MPISTFLKGREPDRLRGLAWLALSGTAVIMAGTVTSDLGGGGTTVYRNVGTAPCRIYPLASSGVSRYVGGAISENSTHMVRVPVGSTISLQDRIVTRGGTYEVLMLPERTSADTRTVEVIKI